MSARDHSWTAVLLSIHRHSITLDRPGRSCSVAEISADTGLDTRAVLRGLTVLAAVDAIERLGGPDRWALTDEGLELYATMRRHPHVDTGVGEWVWDALTGWLDEREHPGRVALSTGHEGRYGAAHDPHELAAAMIDLARRLETRRRCETCGLPEGVVSFGSRHAVCNQCEYRARKERDTKERTK